MQCARRRDLTQTLVASTCAKEPKGPCTLMGTTSLNHKQSFLIRTIYNPYILRFRYMGPFGEGSSVPISQKGSDLVQQRP